MTYANVDVTPDDRELAPDPDPSTIASVSTNSSAKQSRQPQIHPNNIQNLPTHSEEVEEASRGFRAKDEACRHGRDATQVYQRF